VRIRTRSFQQLEFRDPKPFLIQLRELEPTIANSDLPPNIKHLRADSLKHWREVREAALFCYGMAQKIGQTVYLAPSEAQDYDFVASWVVGDTQHFAPVQLKEVVPRIYNPLASIQKTVNSLSKYIDSEDLTVAIHLNQHGNFEPSKIVIPTLKIAALWVFAGISNDQSEWGLWGNFLEKPDVTLFHYPS